ncbi:MAG: Asp23/Gls24 family envelope stress response protein [Firmicutes bacterium]|nr:Asp23/Gls24 family envelope stress response protein [Bacillota bacterium]
MEVQNLQNDNTINEYGNVRISDDVVAVIAELAAKEVKGIVGMSGGIADSITEILGKKSPYKGIKVDVGEKETSIDLFVIVEYGVRIPDIAWQVQESVKKSVETMTGLNVIEVNIHIQGVNIEKDIKEEDGTMKFK